MRMPDETTVNQNEEHLPINQTESEQNDNQTSQTSTPALFDEGETQQNSQETNNQNDTSGNENHETTDGQENKLSADDITLPEGYEYDKEVGNSFLGILNEAKIGKETAQKLFDLYQSQNVKILEGLKAAEAERAKKFEEDLKNEKAAWMKQCEADKEFGGQNWEKNQSVIDKAAKAEVNAVKVLQAYNLHTHPEIVRMFVHYGNLMSEDKSQIQGGNSSKNTDPATAIFGESLREYNERRNKF